MRRLLTFALFLALLGVAVVAAADVSVDTEDVTTFSVPVTIDPPAVAHTFHLRTGPSTLPGTLDPDAPTSNESVHQKEILLGTATVADQADTSRYHVWQTAVVTGGGLMLAGTAVLSISQNGGTDRITAGLFDCPDGAAASSTPATGCVQLGATGTNAGNEGTGFKSRVVSFGTLPFTTVAAGHRLRLKVVNRDTVSSAAWTIQWGFNPARPAVLGITP